MTVDVINDNYSLVYWNISFVLLLEIRFILVCLTSMIKKNAITFQSVYLYELQ